MNNCRSALSLSSAAVVALVLLTAVGPARAGDIRETKHNLVQPEEGDDKRKVAPEEVCVFCHTPTVAEIARRQGKTLEGLRGEVAPPQWQANIKAGHEYSLFDDIGRSGTEGSEAIGSVSMACLSCHDATQAFGVGEGEAADHPFGVPYRGLTLSAEMRARIVDKAKKDGLPVRAASLIRASEDFREARKGVVNRRTVWWASSGSAGAQRSKNDLPLYPRKSSFFDEDKAAGSENEVVIPFIECTSCHDPHSTNAVFLRVQNRGGRLCLTCHAK